ncbi:MAG TPA: alpha/beta hydrolase [Terriglobia bacterium]|nr:alpha/beta hydrolase [Terriglobia bacterium]
MKMHPGIERFVEFPARAGKTLRGMMHLPVPPLKRPAPAVVLFHGFTGHRMESHGLFVKCSRALAKAGIASLRFDFYGSGESDGEFREVTLSGEIADGRAAVAFMRGQEEINPERVGLLGLSLGGAVATVLAPGVHAKALVLWSAVAHPARLRDLIEKSAKEIAGKPGAMEVEAREFNPRLIEDVLKVEPIRYLARYKGPTLIIHPEKDETIPVSHAHDFFHASNAEAKELVIIEGADHVYTSVPWEQEVIVRSVQWFEHYL